MKWYWWAGIVIAVLLGAVTLVPASASKPCFLGYYAHCSFTPISTVLCWMIAGSLYWYGQRRTIKESRV